MKMIGFSPRFASLCAITAIMAGSSLSAAETGKAELTGVKGSVKVDGQAAFVGEVVKPGQKIETGAGAQANLYLADNGPTVVVLPDSSVSFDELSVDKSGAEPVITTKINLKVGTVAGFVKKTSSQSSYIVKGPTVTAVVRTSEYQITDNGTVAVWSGCVTVTYRGASYEVCGGQMFDPAAASVVANTLPLPVGMPSALQQSANAKVTPVVPTRPEPVASPIKTGGSNGGGNLACLSKGAAAKTALVDSIGCDSVNRASKSSLQQETRGSHPGFFVDCDRQDGASDRWKPCRAFCSHPPAFTIPRPMGKVSHSE